MADRHLVSDIGLALLIALPATLPSAPSPWTADTEVSYPSPNAVETLTGESGTVTAASTSKWDKAQPERDV
jgi:hypothetical protein